MALNYSSIISCNFHCSTFILFRDELAIPEIQGEVQADASNREGRFAWYYMTTTLTSVSTSTSTSTTFACKFSTLKIFDNELSRISFFKLCKMLLEVTVSTSKRQLFPSFLGKKSHSTI